MDDIVYKELSYRITGLCFQVQKELGRFCRERQYADRLEELLKTEGFVYERELELCRVNGGSPAGNRVDFVIENKLILDAKAKPFITKSDYEQMQRYLRGADLKLGLVVNFKDTYLKPKRVLNSQHSHVNSHFSHRSKGFSLIELVVAMAIFVTVSSVIVVSQRRFGGNILITNLAYDVALTMRQAQVYGISVRKVKAVSDNEGIQQFNRSYGIYFESGKGYYILFADANNDQRYNTASNSATGCIGSPLDGSLPECVSFFKIEQGNYIKQFCGGTDCYYGPLANNAIDRLEILFHRPEPEPTVRAYKGVSPREPYGSASVTVASPQGVTKSICVSVTGQMSIKATCI